MLFDLQSPGRRRVIKVAYSILAVLFVVGFVGFGVGSEAGVGGIADVFTGGGGSSDDNPFEDEIEAAETRAEQNPKDPAAFAELVQLHYQAGSQAVEIDEETGQQSISESGERELQKGADAWAKYQKLSGRKIETTTATLAVQTYAALADAGLRGALTASSGQDALDGANDAVADWAEAAEAQQILMDARPTASGYSNLAFFHYRAGQIAEGDRATQQAQALAKGAEEQQIQQQLQQVKREGERLTAGIAQLRKAQQSGGAGGDNPLDLGGGGVGGGLGGGGGLSTP
ncbi:MAG: hypothetical protein ACRDL6_00715 [Solirubrobacterales bacterium]